MSDLTRLHTHHRRERPHESRQRLLLERLISKQFQRVQIQSLGYLFD